MWSRNSFAGMTEAAPEFSAARERLRAACRSGDPGAIDRSARVAAWVYHREMLGLLAQRCAGLLRARFGRPGPPARRWR